MTRNFQPVNTTRTYLKPGAMAVDAKFEGTFTETYTDEKFGNLKHCIRQDDGGELVINGCSSLDNQMKKILPGTYVQIIYKGQEKTTKGPRAGKDRHVFHVERDLNSIPPTTTAPMQAAGNTDFVAPDEKFPFEVVTATGYVQRDMSPLEKIQAEKAKFNR